MLTRRLASIVIAVVLADLVALPSHSDNSRAMPPFQPHVDMKTFMEHVLQPAATVIFSVNGVRIDQTGEHDLAPKTDDDWEKIVTAAATLAEATNALMIPQRSLDAEWNRYATRLAVAAEEAYRAAEDRNLKSVSEVSDRLDAICAACHRHYGLE